MAHCKPSFAAEPYSNLQRNSTTRSKDRQGRKGLLGGLSGGFLLSTFVMENVGSLWGISRVFLGSS